MAKNINNNIDNRSEMDRLIDELSAVPEVASYGHHIARILDYNLVDEKIFQSGKKLDAHVEVTLSCKDGGKALANIFFGDNVMQFAKNCERQTYGTTRGFSLSKLLNYFKMHDIEIWISWDEKSNRERVDFYDRNK